MRDRAESLAGELQISPREGGGTQVVLRFPVAPPASGPLRRKTMNTRAPTSVVIIDDHPCSAKASPSSWPSTTNSS
jgi:hypothetical protein